MIKYLFLYWVFVLGIVRRCRGVDTWIFVSMKRTKVVAHGTINGCYVQILRRWNLCGFVICDVVDVWSTTRVGVRCKLLMLPQFVPLESRGLFVLVWWAVRFLLFGATFVLVLVTGDVRADEDWIHIGHLVVRKGDTTTFEARCIARGTCAVQIWRDESNRLFRW